MSGIGTIVTGLSSVKAILDSIKWLFKTIKKFFQKSPVKELERKHEETKDGAERADKEDDTSDVI